MTFENDEARRAYFREELRKKLPELRKIEGFPIGEDEDILALSDPPYYTACPNPWINEFVKYWSNGSNNYRLYKPYAADVTEGKNDPIYNAHSYHTKVPHKAIMRYILNFTAPGDIVFDGFCGSGMTGVAAQQCGDLNAIKELGYKTDDLNNVYSYNESVNEWELFSKVGRRHAVLMDLSPAATFIAYNYTKPYNVSNIESQFNRELLKLDNNYSWMYLTLHQINDENIIDGICSKVASAQVKDIPDILNSNKYTFGKINYVVWSDVYYCPNCGAELDYYSLTWNYEEKKSKTKIVCDSCAATFRNHNDLERVWNTYYDHAINEIVTQIKQVPVLINYSVGKKRFEKKPDSLDIILYNKAGQLLRDLEFPTDPLTDGGEISRPKKLGFTHVHHFYNNRSLAMLSLSMKDLQVNQSAKFFLHGSILPKINKMNRYMPQHGSRALVGPMANALYFPPMHVENNVLDQLHFQAKKIIKALNEMSGSIISTQSSTSIPLEDSTIDYIFVDPPFGANIMYSELSFVRECWLKVITNNSKEAIENKHQNKDINLYRKLMTEFFKEAYRILKPGKWITIEFSNTQAKVWNAIQQALQDSGFIIASVDVLDKKRGGFHAMITTTAVNQDLVISAYKPTAHYESKIINGRQDEQSIWAFIEQHLAMLPIYNGSKGNAEQIIERTPRVLFDRMIAHLIRHGINVNYSSTEFQTILQQRYPVRDGMVFLDSQVAEYDKKRIQAKEFVQLSLFVSDENSAIEWLRQQLLKKPQTRQDLHPNFMKEIQHIAKHELLPELDVLLEQNFLKYDGEGEVPSQIHAYLSSDYKDLRGLDKNDPKLKEKAKNRWYVPDPNKQADLEKLREKSLLREFNQYVEELSNNKKKLKQFRTEAIRVGFYKAWTEKNYQIIVDIGNRLPESILQEDEKLLRYYDNAQTKLGL
jgi:DNA modification methylase